MEIASTIPGFTSGQYLDFPFLSFKKNINTGKMSPPPWTISLNTQRGAEEGCLLQLSGLCFPGCLVRAVHGDRRGTASWGGAAWVPQAELFSGKESAQGCALASHGGGFSCCGVQALELGLSSCGTQAQLLHGMWDPPRPGIKPVSLGL